MESLAEAQRLVKPGGHIALTAAIFKPWLKERFATMLRATTGGSVAVEQHGLWYTFLGNVGEAGAAAMAGVGGSIDLPTDDWPFIYLPEKGIPAAYVWVVACLVLASIVLLRWRGLRVGRLSRFHGHLFFLGAAFLLMEVHAINRLALLFGTVWLVSAVTIAIVLLLIVAANLTVAFVGRVGYATAYAGLALSLGVSWWLEPSAVLGAGRVLRCSSGWSCCRRSTSRAWCSRVPSPRRNSQGRPSASTSWGRSWGAGPSTARWPSACATWCCWRRGSTCCR